MEIWDWLQMQTLGASESFYGKPWLHEDRMNQMEFYGKNKIVISPDNSIH